MELEHNEYHKDSIEKDRRSQEEHQDIIENFTQHLMLDVIPDSRDIMLKINYSSFTRKELEHLEHQFYNILDCWREIKNKANNNIKEINEIIEIVGLHVKSS